MINGGLFAEKIEFKAWNHHKGGQNPSLIIMFLFRWFKFTLKPPYSITHGKLLAIWDTSFWMFLLKFGQKGSQDIS